ncbi:MAG: hypothetical protein KDE28_29785, partial [Anaerolineales bacterium]|nr:hypothetical protein [Anaerolineales bacterium]
MTQFSERLEGLRSDNRRFIEFAERTGIPSTYQTYPDQLFAALEEQAPAFIAEAIAAKSFPKRCYFNFLRPNGHVEDDLTEVICSFQYGQGKGIIFLARWEKQANHLKPLQLSFETIFGPEKSRRHRWIKGYMVELFREGRLTTDTLLLMADELSAQLDQIIDLELDRQRPFLFNSWSEYPQTNSENYLINRGDLIGPDGFGTTLNFYAKIKSDAKLPLDSDALAPFENG